MDNKNVRKMADLLRSGNKMLNKSCPECNSPIFQDKEGNLFCPTCNRQIVIMEGNSSQIDKVTTKKKKGDKKNENDLIDESIRVLSKKIDWLLKKIESENQIENLKRLLILLREIYEILFFLNSKENNK